MFAMLLPVLATLQTVTWTVSRHGARLRGPFVSGPAGPIGFWGIKTPANPGVGGFRTNAAPRP